jgi:hypothetical protein
LPAWPGPFGERPCSNSDRPCGGGRSARGRAGRLLKDGNLTGSGWAWLENFDINTAGFAIVGVFVLTWAAALSIWHIEQKWDLAAAEANVIE